MSRPTGQTGPEEEPGATPLHPQAALAARQDALDSDAEESGAPLPDVAEEAGLPAAWPVVPPVD